MRILIWLKRFLLGSGRPDPLDRQGYRQLFRSLRTDFQQDQSYGTVRIVRLFLIFCTIFFPIVFIDTIADFIIQKCSHRPHFKYVDARIVAIYREFYFITRSIFLVCALTFSWYTLNWVPFLCAYFILEISHAWLGRALAWGKRSINPLRSFVIALLNYLEIVTAFAVLYIDWGSFNSQLSPIQAFYFSLVTASTVGFGDFIPEGNGYYLVVWQISVFFIFVVLVLSTLASHLPAQKRSVHDRGT